MTKSDPEMYSEAETEARREAALKRLLATPHKPRAQAKAENAYRAFPPDGGCISSLSPQDIDAILALARVIDAERGNME